MRGEQRLDAVEAAGELGVGGAAGGLAGSAVMNATEDKFAARAEWRGQRRDLVAVIKASMMAQAQVKLMAGDSAGWRHLMDAALDFHDAQMTEFLIERLAKKGLAKTETSPAEGQARLPKLYGGQGIKPPGASSPATGIP